MILRRSSSRCSRKLMLLISSLLKRPLDEGCTAESGIGCLGGRTYLRGWLGTHFRAADSCRRAVGNRSFWWTCRIRHNRMQVRFHFQLIDFGLDLRLEFVAGALEFRQRAADLAPDLRHLFGAENDQGQHENKNHFGQAEVHDFNDTTTAMELERTHYPQSSPQIPHLLRLSPHRTKV